MNVRALLKICAVKLVPPVFWKRWLKAYYVRKLRLYAQSDAVTADEADLLVVRQIVQKGDTVFDVGANFGYHTLFLSKFVGEQGHVFSIEPVPLTFEILSNGVKQLPLPNVRAFNCGISDKEGSATMEIPTYDSGAANFYQARLVVDNGSNRSLEHVSVSLKSLDSFLPSIERGVGFMKIDVEGHELQAIAGAGKLIERYRPALLIEVSGDPDAKRSPSSSMFEFLSKHGYSPYRYDGHKLIRRTAGDSSVNYFFLTDEQFRRLPASIEAPAPQISV